MPDPNYADLLKEQQEQIDLAHQRLAESEAQAKATSAALRRASAKLVALHAAITKSSKPRRS